MTFQVFHGLCEPCRASRQLQVFSLKFVGSLFVVGCGFTRLERKTKNKYKQMQQEVLSKHLKMNNS